MFGELIYHLGRRYSKERQLNPEIEFPYFSGTISDLLSNATMDNMPELMGEYVIAYNDGQGTKHTIRVYFDQGTFEAEGTLGYPTDFSISSDAQGLID